MMGMEALELAQTTYQIAKAIHDSVQQARANKAQCQRLSERVAIITNTLQGLNAIPTESRFCQALQMLNRTLQECLAFVQQFSQRAWYKRVINAGNHNEKFMMHNQRLAQAIEQLNLGLNVQQVMDHTQDKADQQQDQQAILGNLQEIIRLNQTAHHAFGAFRQEYQADQQTMQQLINNQLQSLRGYLQDLVLPKPSAKKSLIAKEHLLRYTDITFDGKIGEKVLLVRFTKVAGLDNQWL